MIKLIIMAIVGFVLWQVLGPVGVIACGGAYVIGRSMNKKGIGD